MVEEVKAKPNKELIERLEKTLEDARSGHIVSFAICGTYSNCYSFNAFYCNDRPETLIGGLRVLERDLIDCCVDIRKEVDWDYCK